LSLFKAAGDSQTAGQVVNAELEGTGKEIIVANWRPCPTRTPSPVEIPQVTATVTCLISAVGVSTNDVTCVGYALDGKAEVIACVGGPYGRLHISSKQLMKYQSVCGGPSSAQECVYQPCRPLDLLVVNNPHLNVSALTHLLNKPRLVRGKDTDHAGVSVPLSVRLSVFATLPSILLTIKPTRCTNF